MASVFRKQRNVKIAVKERGWREYMDTKNGCRGWGQVEVCLGKKRYAVKVL